MTWDLDVPVGSWTQDGYGNVVTIATRSAGHGFEALVIRGDCELKSGTWTHLENPQDAPLDGRGLYRLSAVVEGDLTLAAGAKIDVSGKGYRAGKRPFKGRAAKGGASHGGNGGVVDFTYFDYAESAADLCYGSLKKPECLGSGSCGKWGDGYPGGGAVRLVVSGKVLLDGEIRAQAASLKGDGTPITEFSGAGGSIWITAGAIEGSGLLNARGTAVTECSAGGGGRIALHLTGDAADFSSFTGTIELMGFNRNRYDRSGVVPCVFSSASGGTCYLQTKGDQGVGKAIFYGDGGASATPPEDDPRLLPGYGCELRETDPEAYHFKDITLVGEAQVRVCSNATLRLESLTTPFEQGKTNTIALAGGTLEIPSGLELTGGCLSIEAPGSTIAIRGDGPALAFGTNFEVRADYPLSLTGDIRLKAGSRLTHWWNMDCRRYAIDLAIDGNLTVDEGAAIDAEDKGYSWGHGPGASPEGGAPAHGGLGRGGLSAPVYGSIREPVSLGTGVGSWVDGLFATRFHGGGAIKISTSGETVINGEINADPGKLRHTCGSGGSIWLTTGTLSGTGRIHADGGTLGEHGWFDSTGGGGRVAVHLTSPGADFSAFEGAMDGRISANGGRNIRVQHPRPLSGNGTVYLQTAAQDPRRGTLLIANADAEDTAGCGAKLTRDVADQEVGDVVIAPSGNLILSGGDSLKVAGDWSNAGTFSAEAGSEVSFIDGGSVSRVSGPSLFHGLVCETPGKTMVFATSGVPVTIAEGGRLSLKGTAGEPVVLRSETNGVPWGIVLPAGADQGVIDVSVSDSDASGGATVYAANSTGTSCRNWSFVEPVPGALLTWTGAASTSFREAGNWTPVRPPVATDRVLIPGGAGRFPVLVSDTVVSEMTVEAGAELGTAGHDLHANALSVAGTLRCSGRETIRVDGGPVSFAGGTMVPADSRLVLTGEAVVFDPGATTFGLIDCSGARSLRVTDGFEARGFNSVPAVPSSIAFAAGKDFTVGELELDGERDGEKLLSLSSTTSGLRWRLGVTASHAVKGVVLDDCDASPGQRIYAFVPSSGTNDVDVVFGTTSKSWVGPAGGDFLAPGNWSDGVVPGPADCVEIDRAASIKVTAPSVVREVLLGGGAEAVSLAISPDATLEIADSLRLRRNATLIANGAVVVGASVRVSDGAVITHDVNPADGSDPNKVRMTVGGDFTIEEGGIIDLEGKGYPYINRDVSWVPAGGKPSASHGGRGMAISSSAIPDPCYGSILDPRTPGAASPFEPTAAGGGVAILSVGGVLRIDGEINADGLDQTPEYPWRSTYNTSAGGSVNLTCASLVGTGRITADGAPTRNDNSGAGGRIAIVQTVAPGNGFQGRISTYGGYLNKGSAILLRYPWASCGTIYRRNAGEREWQGVVDLANGNGEPDDRNTTIWFRTDLPVADDGNPRFAYRGLTFIVRDAAGLNLTGDVTIEDLEIPTDNARILLNGHTLRIRSGLHRHGRGWAAGMETLVLDGDATGGRIVWGKNGTLMLLR